MSSEDLEASLAQIRTFKNSKIPVQVKQATLLAALESTISQDVSQITPAAYFASLMALLDQSEVTASAVYLLSLVVPHISQALLMSKLDILVSKLAPILTDSESDVANIRAAISVLEIVLSAQSLAAWQIPFNELGPLRTMSGLLALAQDGRPKIRKRAVEAIDRILSNPPEGTKNDHPALSLAADISLEAISLNNKETSKSVHALNLLKAVCSHGWPARRSDELLKTLLQISRTSDQYVVMAAFDVFDALFQSLDPESAADSAKVEKIIAALLELAPAKTDKQLAPAWFAAVAQAYSGYARVNATAAFASLPSLLETLITYLVAPAQEVVESSSQCMIAAITETIVPEVLLEKESQAILENISTQLFQLLRAEFQAAWVPICGVFTAFIDQSRYLAPVDDSIRVIGVLRSDENLSQSRNATDQVIAAAIRSLGPEKVIELIPLQLSVKTGAAAGRAWMLPLLRDNIQGATLEHFKSYFIPLSEELDAAAKSMQNERNAKIISTVKDQIWSLLPRYFDLPADVTKSLKKDFVSQLMTMLYENVEYRVIVTNALKLLVESNVVYSQGAIEDPLVLARFPIERSEASLKYISQKFASDILKVLLNVFSESSTGSEARNAVYETINVYFSIVEPSAIEEMFNQVSSVLAESIKNGNIPLVLTMLDVLTSLAGYLSAEAHPTFYNIFNLLAPRTENAQIQKKIYQAFARLVESETGSNTLKTQIDVVQSALLELTSTVQAPARRARLQVLTKIVELLPDESLHFIPNTISEVILSTKDVNEKTREASFELLTVMGRRMQAGGVIDHGKMPDIDDDGEVAASLNEYFTMLLAGLLGSTPHMISASITAVTYVFYEFKDDLDAEQAREIVDTVWTFLSSANREIVNSVLGFVKVSILVTPTEQLEPHLKELLENLLGWGKEHKQHFKSKVRHIVERLLRRFGYDTLSKYFPEDDMKLLQNVHKSKERAKKKKTTGSSATGKERKFDDELDEALYGSSEDSEAEEEEVAPKADKNGKNAKSARGKQYIINGDEPLDLLDQSALGRISSTKPENAKPKRELRHKLKEKEGRMVIKEDDDDETALDGKSAIAAYVDAVRSGPVRTQSGKLKFKRGKRAQADSDDDGSDDEQAPRKPQQQNRKFAAPKPKARFPKRRRL